LPRLTKSVLATAALTAAAALAAPGAAHAAPAFTCEASALRGTVLGTAIEPVVFGRGQACKSGQTVPTIALPELLDASVLVAAATKIDDDLRPGANAAGGLAGARIKLLPSLPIQLPTEQVVGAIEPIRIPLGAAGLLLGLPNGEAIVDIRDAVRALAPGGLLPQADLLSAGVLSSVAAATCDGESTPKLAGASTVAGLRLLGQPIDVDTALQQNINVVDSASIDPSDIDISQVDIAIPGQNVLSPQVVAAVQGLLRPVLDGLPNIEIPAAVAQVRLTADEQLREGSALTQRALRVQASLLGTSLVDLVIGEAKVSATGDCPRVSASAGEPAEPAELQCTDRKLVLLDVFEERGRVRLRGAANRDFVGKDVAIRFRAGGNRVVARAKVARNGSFETTAPLPRSKVRRTNAARYTAVRGRERSLPLKLVRRMRTSSVTSDGGVVTIRGRVSRPLARPVRQIRLVRRVACGRAQLIKRFKPRSDGSFVVRVKASSRPAVYRATTRVRKVVTNPKTYPTFTLPRGIDLNQR
jgi:hypothetical protein